MSERSSVELLNDYLAWIKQKTNEIQDEAYAEELADIDAEIKVCILSWPN
jgi:hypothetical protein